MSTKKKALANIQTMDMFSKAGWKEVHKLCGDISPHADNEELANGFIDFQRAWYDDNGFDYESFDDEEREDIEEQLIGRYSDYLLKD